MRIVFCVLTCLFLFSQAVSLEDNYTKYNIDYCQKNNLVGCTIEPLKDGFMFGNESFWFLPFFFVFIYLLWMGTKNESFVGMMSFLSLIVLNYLFPSTFLKFCLLIVGSFIANALFQAYQEMGEH